LADTEIDDIRVAESAPDADQQAEAKLRKFLRIAIERFKLAQEAEQKTRRDALDDLKFRAGEQWPSDIQTSRGLDGRPCLTINRLPPIIRQITNEQRQQRPSINVNPVGSGSDQDTAEMLQGVVRHIEVNSDAEIAYDTAFESAVTIGFGFWGIETDYLPKSFDHQEIKIRRIKNPFMVYFDPSACEPCYEDAMWAFEVKDIPKDEYKLDYPNSKAAALMDFESIGDQAPDWADKDTIRVAMYWHVEQAHRELVKTSMGDVKWADEVNPQTETVIARRKVLDRKVIKSKINAIEILEETQWPGNWIGLVPVLADDLEIDGKRHLAGIVRDAKDPQRMYNYWHSSATETIALAPRAPYLATPEQIEGHEKEWAVANNRNLVVLPYNAASSAGNAVPVPQRQQYEPPIQSMNLMLRNASDDLKSVTGVFDPSLGQQKSDQSGKAVQLLQKQSDVSNLHFTDNLSRAMRHTGRLLIDLIPKIYDSPRVQRIINPDQTVDHVIVHSGQPTEAQGLGNTQDPAIAKIYDLSEGEYDVTVSVGPSYQSKRQEAVASIMALVSAYPNVMQVAGDLLVGQMDWPMAKHIAERLKKMLPPALQDEDDTDPEMKVQQMQAQMQQMMQQHDLLVKALNETTDKLKTDYAKQQANISIANLNNQTKIAIAEITTAAQTAITRATIVADVMKELHGSAHELALQKDQQGHEQDMQATQQDHEADQADQEQQNQQDLAAQKPPAGGANGNVA
jgi:hypothetical protein